MPTASLPQTLAFFHVTHCAYELTRRPADVAAKRQAAAVWCVHAFTHAGNNSWRYALVPPDVVAENMSLAGFLARHE